MNCSRIRSSGRAALASLAVLSLLGAELRGEPLLELELEIGRALHPAAAAENFRAVLVWSGLEPELRLSADALTLPEPLGRVENLRVVCPRVRLSSTRVGCAQAQIDARLQGVPFEWAPLAFTWHRQHSRVDFSGSWPKLFGAQGRFAGTAEGAGVRLDFEITELSLPAVMASPWWPLEATPVVVGAGELALSGRFDTRAVHPELELSFVGSGVEFSDREGLRAGEDLALDGRVFWGERGWDVQLGFSGGAVFLDPWFLDFGEVGPLAWNVANLHPPTGGDPRWRVGALDVALGDALRLEARGLAGTAANIDAGAVSFVSERMDVIGTWLVSPLLAGTVLGSADFDGSVAANLGFGQGRLRDATLDADGLAVVDAGGRFALRGISGKIRWHQDVLAEPSALTVRDGQVLGIPLGAFAADFQLYPRGIRLLAPVEVPVLDGALRAAVLRVEAGVEGPRVDFEGGIRALSLEQLTEALGWPPFAGTLSGVIPRVRYDRGVLAVDGRLLVQVFDGDLVLRDLEIRDLFGPIPVLEMGAEIRRIDLDLLTRAFDVGRIEGRLSGNLSDLVLVDWVPRRMNLTLATPEEHPGRRRISQRAVDNLTEIGGGLQAALSAPFLRFFDDFPYRRLGIGCALEGDRCRMSGVADRADGSFVLVEGRGIPHLQVIGYTREVDWPVLIQRLQAVRGRQDPAVE